MPDAKPSKRDRIKAHVKAHKSKYVGGFLFAIVVLVCVHRAESGGPIFGLAIYKIVECFGDVVADRLFPDTFLRG